MEGNFGPSVEFGLKLAKRVRSSKDSSVTAPKPAGGMERLLSNKPSFEPTAPMVYAVISDPAIVDNPEIPSYQPYVHGRCDPPALIPLHMNDIAMEVDCCLDSAFVSVRGSWRLHCVMASRNCDCRLVVPMGEEGSLLSIEVGIAGRSYSTHIMQMDQIEEMRKKTKDENGGFLRPHVFFLTIPRVCGGSIVSISMSWFQQLLYIDSRFSLNVPFIFPDYVMPPVKISPTREKIQLNVNTGIKEEVICDAISHPLKEMSRQMGTLSFSYDAEVLGWSNVDFYFSFMVSVNDIFGGILLQSPSLHDFDQREMFCLYLFPGNLQEKKVFSKGVVFLVDISGSMQGKPLENVKTTLAACLSGFDPSDFFSIIAFNDEMDIFSSSLESATMANVENAIQWMNKNFVAEGGTSIHPPLCKAMEMISDSYDSIPHIFLITDGAVEDERNICRTVKTHVTSRGAMSPCISTFGIGSCCNHYFLRMLAQIGKGLYDAAYDADSINVRMQSLFIRATSSILRNLYIESINHLESFQVYPFPIPDLSSECPLILSGRYSGRFPESLKLTGVLADKRNAVIDMKVQKSKDIPFDKVFAKRQINVLTAQAWLSESKLLEEKVMKISMQTGFTSEYTRLVLRQNDKLDFVLESAGVRKVMRTLTWKDKGSSQEGKTLLLKTSITNGFGSVTETMENAKTLLGEETSVKNEALSKMTICCTRVAYCCCPRCIPICIRMSDECAIVYTQICTALSCFGCIRFCMEVCCEWDCT